MSGHSKWANIKHKKAKVDEQRGKLFTKLGKDLIVAARLGGGDPDANPRLKMAIQKAREANMSADSVQRAIAKALGETSGANYEELVYEGYGPGGVAVILNLTTDNRNRTAAEIRHLFSRCGGNLGESGCVAWMFQTRGLITIDLSETRTDPEEIMLWAIEAGAEDVDQDKEGSIIEIVTEPGLMEDVRDALTAHGLPVASAEVTTIPKNTVSITDPDTARRVLRLLDALEDHDDVQNVASNFDIPIEIMEQLEEG